MTITAKLHERLFIGETGENGAVRVFFPFAGAWEAEYGPGVFTLLVQRPEDTDPYAVTVTREGESAVWTVSDTDTARAGIGKAELDYRVGGILAKSVTWELRIVRSLSPPAAEPPEPWQSWVDEVTEAGSAAVSSAAAAAASQEAAAQSAASAEADRIRAERAADAAAAAEAVAVTSAADAALARDTAVQAALSTTFPTFTVYENGHVMVEEAQLLGTTRFVLANNGHLEVHV